MTRASTIALATTALPRVWAYDNSPRVKPSQAAHTVAEGVFDYAALELAVAQAFGLRHAEVAADLQRLASAQPWDPAPPLRMGPQRCLSSRETIERLAFVLPKPRPALTPKEAGALLSAWWSKYPAAREYFPERPKATRHVWMGGDYIDDGTHKATPEEAAERWRQVREALVSIEREGGTVAYVNPAYPPHTRDTLPRG